MLIKGQRFTAVKAVILFGLLFVHNIHAATVTKNTLAAWEKSVQQSKSKLPQKSTDLSHLVSSYEQVTRIEDASSTEVHVPAAHGSMTAVPSGLIHHWFGFVFVPGARVADALHVLQDYDAYAELYKPAVVQSRLLSHAADEFRYQLKFVQREFGIKAGLTGDFQTTYFRLNETAGYSVTESTQLTELQNPEETAVPMSHAHGYIEKVFTIVKYQETTQGLSVEVETLTLSRDVNATVRWLVAPIIQRFSHQTMEATLVRLRDKIKAVQTVESASNR